MFYHPKARVETLIKGQIMYCAIIGDIINSRKIVEGRGEVQERFKAVMDKINHTYSQNIASDFTITEGDGFYGLLHSPNNLLNIILEVRLAIVPHQIRMGIGIGSIGTKIEKFKSNLIDGRANATAREAIDYLYESRNKYESVYRTTMLKVDSTEYTQLAALDRRGVIRCKTYESLINTIFCSCSYIEKKWNTIHADTIKLKADQNTQREIAAKLGISQSAVQKRLIAAEYYRYESYLESLESGIEELWKEVQHV